ncbi:12813_t:CDS:2, partial [Funneliformis geosporum]
SEKKYSLVLQYADSSTLKTYLNDHFDELQWNDKLRLALQLANAVLCLHEFDIIHRDLKNIKLSDFGLSRKIAEAPSDMLQIFSVIPYIDPKWFGNKNQNFELNKKSDVYSVGVLLWQISSGRRPFYAKDVNYDIGLAFEIINGKREKVIDGTPIEYSNLYQECWNLEPNQRPDMQKVFSTLDQLKLPKSHVNIFMPSEITSDIIQEDIHKYNATKWIENALKHSKNIVIHENNAKITDFGISKNENIQDSTIHNGIFGCIPYMEPKRILDLKFPYTKSSDIYSYGVLMWEISSGYPPFEDYIIKNNIIPLAVTINKGTREKTIPDLYVEFDTEIADNHNNSTSESQFINFLENH